jgi:hypothetical protein
MTNNKEEHVEFTPEDEILHEVQQAMSLKQKGKPLYIQHTPCPQGICMHFF